MQETYEKWKKVYGKTKKPEQTAFAIMCLSDSVLWGCSKLSNGLSKVAEALMRIEYRLSGGR